MLVGCTFLDRRDAAGALVAHAVIFRAVINFAVPRTVNGTGRRGQRRPESLTRRVVVDLHAIDALEVAPDSL